MAEVFEVLGTRSTSPFKRVNIDQAVKPLSAPRVTRKSDEGKEVWLPTAEEFVDCKSADEFRDKVAEGEGHPAAELWKYPQSCLVHLIVFEAFGFSSTKRARELALEIISGTKSTSVPECPRCQLWCHRVLRFMFPVYETWNKTLR
jgi:hypothetical protein